MFSTMNSPWGNGPPGTQVAFNGYPQSSPLPAYNTVPQPRQFFNPPPPAQSYQVPPPYNPPPAPATTTEEPPRKKINWPQPVRDYVRRSFEPQNIVPDVSRAEMEAKLKQTISDATDNGTLHSVDWDRLDLPQILIRTEREKLKAVSWAQQPPNPVNGSSTSLQTGSKKRKSQELSGPEDDSNPPWRSSNGRGLGDRITFDKKQNTQNDTQNKGTSKSQKAMEKRQRRFEGGYKSGYKASPEPEAPSGPVVGTCQDLEKGYLRLTAAPVPSQVRPEHILRQSLEFLKKKWKKEGNYPYICDQFKSMRQDLTVQRIANEFTTTVYEIHARIALEKGDLGEYNACQSRLRGLYMQGLGGNPSEFKAYRILYLIHTANRTALNDVLADLTIAEKKERPIKHALDVRSALALGNYNRFFRLYLDTPNMGAYLMDMFVHRERLAAMANICRAFKPDVKLRFITEELAFESDSDAAQFICDNDGQHLLEEKDDGLRFLTAKAGQLFENKRRAAVQSMG